MIRLAHASIRASVLAGLLLTAAGAYVAASRQPDATADIRLSHGPIEHGLARLTAEITPPGADEALRVHLQMYDGEEVTLALPGHPGTHYHFRRAGDVVLASVPLLHQ